MKKIIIKNDSNEQFGKFKIQTITNKKEKSKFVKKETIIDLTNKNYKILNKKFNNIEFVDYFKKSITAVEI